jgi:NodT family efflux transporter outer membrane factor (OMF) lipoprotein
MRAIRKRWVLIASLAALMSCGCQTKAPPSGDDIRKSALPSVVLPQSWKSAPVPADLIQDNWLASFQDAQLTALTNEAVANNPDLRVAATRVEQANNYVDLAKAALRPAVNIFGTGGFKAGGGGDLTGALQGVMLGVSWEADVWGRLRYARNAAEENYASARDDVEFARQSLAATTAKSWFAVTETYLQRQIAEDTVRSGQELVNMAVQRADVGAGSGQEVAAARANLGNFQDALLQIQLAHQQALRSMELLLGRYPAAELQARETLTAMPGPVPVGIPLQMLERRPDLLAAEHRVAVAFNQIGQAKAAQLPKITLNASFGVLNSEVLQLKQDFSNPTGGAGARLLAPIYAGGALKAQVQIQKTEQKTAIAQYAGMALRAIGDVENALAAGQTLNQRAQLLDQVVAEYQKALDFAQSAYRVGRRDLRNVEEQQLALYSARIALLRVQSDQLSQRVNLYLALGGSFDQTAAAKSSAANAPRAGDQTRTTAVAQLTQTAPNR